MVGHDPSLYIWKFDKRYKENGFQLLAAPLMTLPLIPYLMFEVRFGPKVQLCVINLFNWKLMEEVKTQSELYHSTAKHCCCISFGFSTKGLKADGLRS